MLCPAQVYTNRKRALTKAVNQAKKDAAAGTVAALPAGAPAAGGAPAVAGGILQMPGIASGQLPPPGALPQYPAAGSRPPPVAQGAGQGFDRGEGAPAHGIASAAMAAVHAQVSCAYRPEYADLD